MLFRSGTSSSGTTAGNTSTSNTPTTYPNGAPYPQSTFVTGITFNHGTLTKAAPGSDEWTYTEGSDGNLYFIWGDGGGFGGTNSRGRVGLGVGRISDTPPSWTGKNISGGVNPLSSFVLSGGAGGSNNIFFVGNTLYTLTALNRVWSKNYLFRSTNFGKTWQNLGDIFTSADNFGTDGVVQYGPGGSGALDSYIYIYSSNSFANGIALARVSKSQLANRSSYRFFAGFDANGNPVWSSNTSQMKSIFNDSKGTRWGTSATYDSYINRYLLSDRKSVV